MNKWMIWGVFPLFLETPKWHVISFDLRIFEWNSLYLDRHEQVYKYPDVYLMANYCPR